MGAAGNRCCIVQEVVESFPPFSLPPGLPVLAGRVRVSRNLPVVRCRTASLPLSSFSCSSCSHSPVPFTFPALPTQRTTGTSTPKPHAPLRHFPVPAPHCCPLKPFSLPSGPCHTPPPPRVPHHPLPPRSAQLLRGLRGELTSHPCSRDSHFFFSFHF